MMFFRRAKSITKTPSSVLTPTKPNFSAIMAKTESSAAPGKYPLDWTLLAIPRPNNPPEPTVISAWQAWYPVLIQSLVGFKSIYLEPLRGKIFSYAPGQFAFVRFYTQRLSSEEHHFTISSSPSPLIA